MAELTFNAILALISVIAMLGCLSIPIPEQPLARYWPMTILCALFIMLSLKVAALWKKIPSEERKAGLSFLHLEDKNIQRLIAAFVAAVLYAIALSYVGYIVATLVFGVVMVFLLGGKNMYKNILITLLITALLYAVFTWGIRIHPARGIGVFAKFSKWLEYMF